MSFCLLCLLALLGTALCGGCLNEDRFGAGEPFDRTAELHGIMSGEMNASEAGANPMNIQQYLGSRTGDLRKWLESDCSVQSDDKIITCYPS